jgi:hypothetical protein
LKFTVRKWCMVRRLALPIEAGGLAQARGRQLICRATAAFRVARDTPREIARHKEISMAYILHNLTKMVLTLTQHAIVAASTIPGAGRLIGAQSRAALFAEADPRRTIQVLHSNP